MADRNLFTALGSMVSRAGDSIYDISQARYKLYENQVNEVINLAQSSINNKLEAYVVSAQESDLPMFYKNAREKVWDVYSSIDELKRNTNNRFSDEVYQDAYGRIQSQLLPKFESLTKTYEDVSAKVALKSEFENSFTTKSANENWMDMNDAKASAKNYSAMYASYASEFNGFEYVNDNGVFDVKGANGQQLLMINGFSRALDDFTKQKAKQGIGMTTEEFIDDFGSWWNVFSKQMGFNGTESKNYFNASRESIKSYFEKYKEELQTNAEESKNKAFQAISNDSDGYLTNGEMVEIFKMSGLSDYETNYYSNQALSDVVSMMYNVNAQFYEDGLTDVVDSFIDGKFTVKDGNDNRIDYETFIKNGVAHHYDGKGNEVEISEREWFEYDSTGLSRTDKKTLGKIYEIVDNIGGDKKSGYRYNFEDISRNIAKQYGYDDEYTPVVIDKILTERFLHETGDDDGLIKSQVNNITAIINSDKYSTEQKGYALDMYYKNGYLDDAQYLDLKYSISFSYKNQYNQIMNTLEQYLVPEAYKFISTNPEAIKYIQHSIDAVGGNITGKVGQQLIVDLRTKFKNELSDSISTSSLSAAMSALTTSSFYKNGPLTQLGDYNTGEVMNKYYNGEYNYLGIDYLVEQIKPMVMTTKSGKMTKNDVVSLLEQIWNMNGYSGTYKESKSDYKKEICELALLVATCNVSNDETLSGYIDGALGEDVSNILIYDGITQKYSPVVMNSDGIGVMLESTGSGEPMFRLVWVHPSKAESIIGDGIINSSSTLLNMSEKAYSSYLSKKRTEVGSVDIGQETFYKYEDIGVYSTMKDSVAMMGMLEQFNTKYVVPYKKSTSK